MQTLAKPGPAALVAGLAAGAAFWAVRRAADRTSQRRPAFSRPGAPRVLILGAGFGGITTAIELGSLIQRGLNADVLLIDRTNYHLFTPMLYQVATGLLEPGQIAYPARELARRYGFRFREGQVEGIGLEERTVTVNGERLSYDRLVIALGSVTNYFGNASIEQAAASLKTLGNAVAIRNRVIEAFERADVERDVAARQALLTFVVVGGGATGVELVGSLWTLIQNGLLPLYPNVDPREIRVILAEAGPSLLSGMDPWIGETARRRLEEKGIEVALANPATEVTEAGITFKDSRSIASKTVVWAAGVRPSPLTAALPVERGRDGRLVVDPRLRLADHPDAFALGDCAWFPVPENDGRPAPPNAQTAVRQAKIVARNVAASLQGRPLAPFRYANEGNLVALGQGDGVALVGTRRLEGFPAWLTWRGFYLTQLMGFKNRLGVLLEWTSAYLGHRGRARLDVTGPPSAPPTSPAAVASAAPRAAEKATPARRSKATATAKAPAAPSPEQRRTTSRSRSTSGNETSSANGTLPSSRGPSPSSAPPAEPGGASKASNPSATPPNGSSRQRSAPSTDSDV